MDITSNMSQQDSKSPYYCYHVATREAQATTKINLLPICIGTTSFSELSIVFSTAVILLLHRHIGVLARFSIVDTLVGNKENLS